MVATRSRWPGIAAAEPGGLEELHEAADGVGGYLQCDHLGHAQSGCYDLSKLGPLETL